MIIKNSNRIGVALLTIFTVCVVYYVLKDANWVLGDDAQQFIFTGSGKFMPMNTYSFGMDGTTMGRFAPFAHMEYNILPILGFRSAFAHYVVNSVLFIIYVIFAMLACRETMLSCYKEYNILLFSLIFITLFCASSAIFGVMEVFSHVFQFMCLSIFFFLFARYWRNKEKWLLYISVPIVFYMTFCVETNFIIVFTFGVAIEVLCLNNITLRKYGVVLMLVSISYIVCYAIVEYSSDFHNFYQPTPFAGIFLFQILEWIPEVILLYILIGYRLWRVFIKKEESCVPADVLLVSGGVVTLSFLVLRMRNEYYYMYTSFFVLPTMLVEAQRLLNKNKKLFVICSILILLFFVRPLHVFPYTIKNMQMQRRTDVADAKNVIDRLGSNTKMLFFLKANMPKADFANNLHFAKSNFITYYISYLKGFKIKSEDVSVDDSLLDKKFLFICSEDNNCLNRREKELLMSHYDSVADLTSMNTVLYKRKYK